jgi:hypothetical protein
MQSAIKSKADKQFAASQKKSEVALKEKEKLQLERAGHTANLRALRLAKEASDKKTSEIAVAKKVPSKKIKTS